MNIAIIGAGLAGCSLAFKLKRYGVNVNLYDAGNALANGASGNQVGLINPRFSAFRTPESDYFTSAYSAAIRAFQSMDDIDWLPCGALHLMSDDKKRKRFPQTLDNWQWPDDQLRMLSADEASDVYGIALHHDALYLPDSGCVNPKKLCKAYAEGVSVHLNTKVETLQDLDADIIVLACGMGLKNFAETKDLPVKAVRGQVTYFKNQALEKARSNLCYGGYCSPAIHGVHTVGATFQRWLDHSDILDQDDAENLSRLSEALQIDVNDSEIVDHLASVRTASKDHFPIIGALPKHPNIYVSAAHGSHGILSSLAGAELITDMILKRPLSQSLATMYALSPDRFLNEYSA